jgi:Domain of unknown function (DUF4169)
LRFSLVEYSKYAASILQITLRAGKKEPNFHLYLNQACLVRFSRYSHASTWQLDVIALEVALVQCHRVGVICSQSSRPQAANQHLVTAELCMSDIVNLRIARKRAKRRAAETEAASNRLAHGHPKIDRAVEQSRREKARRSLDQHRIETGDTQ